MLITFSSVGRYTPLCQSTVSLVGAALVVVEEEARLQHGRAKERAAQRASPDVQVCPGGVFSFVLEPALYREAERAQGGLGGQSAKVFSHPQTAPTR